MKRTFKQRRHDVDLRCWAREAIGCAIFALVIYILLKTP